VVVEKKEHRFNMPAKSKHQQRAFAMALAARRGEIPVNRLGGAARQLYYTKLTNEQLRDFAKTKIKGLPTTTNRKIK